MSWDSKEFIQNQRYHEFSFFVQGGEDGKITESIAPGTDFGQVPWKLAELRVHLSVVFPSVEDLTMRISAVKGSQHNLMILSQAMNGLVDLLWQADVPMNMLSNDQIVLELSMVSTASTTNVIGITMKGWAAIG